MRARRAYRVLFSAAFALAVLPTIVAAQAKKAEITGKWLFTVTSSAGTGTPTVTLKQQGDSLTGHYSSQLLGEQDLLGTVKDLSFSFTIHAEVQGTPLTAIYKGTLEGDSMKGTVDFGGLGSGTFTGKRQASP